MKTIWKLVETCILPILLYAAETRIPTKTEVEHIQKILNNTLKIILQTLGAPRLHVYTQEFSLVVIHV